MANLLFLYVFVEPSVTMVEDFLSSVSEEYSERLEVKFKKTADVNSSDIEWSDIVISIRPQRLFSSKILKLAKKYKRLTGVCIDDDLLAIDGFYRSYMMGSPEIRRSLKYSDIIISPNKHLANKLIKKSCTNRYIILNTSVDSTEIRKREFQEKKCTRIVSYSNVNNTEYFDCIITPTMDSLFELYGNRLEWFFYNVHPDISSTPYDATYYSKMSLHDFRESLSNGEYDIGIMPMSDNEFNNGKYVNHFFEYTRAGIPGIYSNIEPYSSFINNKKDGVLSDNNPSDWVESIKLLVDIKAREEIINNAQERVMNEFSNPVIFDKFLSDFPELYSFKAPDKRIHGMNLLKAQEWINERIIKWFVWIFEVIRISKYTRRIKKLLRMN